MIANFFTPSPQHLREIPSLLKVVSAQVVGALWDRDVGIRSARLIPW